MSHEIVAENSKNLAEKYAREGNFGRAFSHYLVALNLKPDWRPQFREEFSTVLCKWGTLMDEKKRFEDLFKCYEQAIEIFPNDVVILNNLGAHLLRCGLLKEAAHYFRKCLAVNPYFLRAALNLENVSNLAVERWHFRMLNDEHRNEAFREAIIKKIKQGFDRVLDVGTGTGILSLFCFEGKAKEIYACDSSPIMTEIAGQVFRSNNATGIKLINKHSSELCIPEDILGRVSLLVTETFDAGLLGEDILHTLSHAWEHLLLPPQREFGDLNEGEFGVVIPFGATVYVTGVELDAIANDFHLKDLENSFSFGNYNALQMCENYDTQDLSRSQFRCLTKTEKILEINFNDPDALAQVLQGWRQDFGLRCEVSGRLDCFAVWFDLNLDEDIVLSTSPLSKSNGAWDQAVFPLPRSVPVEKEQNVEITVTFKNRKLSISSNNNPKDGQNVELSESVIKTLNNQKLSQVLNQVIRKLRCTFNAPANILDCYPFPVFGLNFLISRRDRFKDKLICFVPTKNDERLVRIIAERYGVTVDVRVQREIDFEEGFQRNAFDVVLLDLVDISGEIKDGILLQFNHLQSLLRTGGIILPAHVSVIGQFIYSDWLSKTSRVDSLTCGYNIKDYINTYQVQHFIDLDLKSIDAVIASEAFELFNLIDPRESMFEMKIPVNTKVNAMAYWLKIRFTEGCDEILTSDDNSHHQCAILLFTTESHKEIKFNVIRNNGLFSVELLKI